MQGGFRIHVLTFSFASRGANNHEAFGGFFSFRLSKMGDAGIKINAVALFDDEFRRSMVKSHRSFQNIE
jgi:hypothetical protein